MKSLFLLVAFTLLGTLVFPDVEAGFGCPFNQYRCSSYCQSIDCKAGYCNGPLKLTCTCVRCHRDRSVESNDESFPYVG